MLYMFEIFVFLKCRLVIAAKGLDCFLHCFSTFNHYHPIMKRSTLLLLFALFLAVPAAMAQSAGAPKLNVLSEKTYQFGTIEQGDRVSHVFNIQNAGDAPLKIKHAKGSCGCTVPQWPRDAIAPGEKATINVTFNSAGKMGRQKKSVTLRTNEEKQSTHILFLEGKVVRKGQKKPQG